jgi:hypothetical protein
MRHRCGSWCHLGEGDFSCGPLKAVIPAKAGILWGVRLISAEKLQARRSCTEGQRHCRRVDSRFRGNDCAPNDTSTHVRAWEQGLGSAEFIAEMTYCPILRCLLQMVQAHGQGLVLGVGKRVHFGVVDLTEQSPCDLCPTTGTAP